MATNPKAETPEEAHLRAEAAQIFPTEAESQYPLPPSVIDVRQYTDEAQFKREMTGIFFRSWLPIAPTVDVAKPRDVLVWDRLDQSIVVTRQDDMSVAAFHNVCQHRGARLVAGSGSCQAGRFFCPWHGFQYDLTGKVRAVPLREAFDPVRLEGLRAPPVRVREWGGFIWICLADDVPELEQYLGTIHDELSFYNLDTFETKYRFELEFDANWKVVVDAFN